MRDNRQAPGLREQARRFSGAKLSVQGQGLPQDTVPARMEAQGRRHSITGAQYLGAEDVPCTVGHKMAVGYGCLETAFY